MHPNRREAIVYRSLDDRGWALDPVSDRLYKFNRVARTIWELCNGRSTIPEIASTVSQRYEVDYGRAIQDTQDFLHECAIQGLLLISDQRELGRDSGMPA